jgi:SSS family solute:Na+ symporter
MFLGLFWKRGNKQGALAGLLVGFAVAVGLTSPYAGAGGAIPWLEGLASGLVALAANLVVYVACAYLIPQSEAERRRVEELFAESETPEPEPERPAAPAPEAVPVPGPAAA